MSRVNIIPDKCYANGSMNVKNDNSKDGSVFIEKVNSTNNYTSTKQYGCNQMKSSAVTNDRLNDFNILEKQIKSNPFNVIH